MIAGLAGWTGLSLQPFYQGLAATCGEVSLWVLWQVTRQTIDPKLIAGLVLWGASMLLAMMAPGLFRPVAFIISQSLPRRAVTLIFAFFMAYTIVWLPGVAILLLGSGAALEGLGRGSSTMLLSLLVWYGWTCTPIHQLALNRGHVLCPLRSFSGALPDVFRLGVQHGSWCIVSCWPLMLIPMLSTGLSGPLMLACSVAGALMRALPRRTVRWRISGFFSLGSALLVTWLWCVRRARDVAKVAIALLAARSSKVYT